MVFFGHFLYPNRTRILLINDTTFPLFQELVQDTADDDEIDALMLSIEDEDSQDRFLREISRELP